LAEIFVQDI